ncbi:C3 and PZP-like alpha-2-macroglobulin domain-containing protein 8 [Gigantopelta aegis]|uniref:C3 and PZP-like alpha-2-macroglobulin domain-containing protein 8 n=1 Tax=Gigantopelta aegis TaxID=1735272 RepID=UPI001B88C367|nr:C3 and PZP-like alpha-2-macroglobulin domain-containing protein 8 [Gigantopelta aegis]
MNVGIKICMEYLLRNTTSGVAVAEVGTLSGFQPITSYLDKQHQVRRYEVEKRRTVLYFDRIQASRTCVTMEYRRIQLVARTAAVPLRVYSYYDPRQEVITYFQLPKLNNMGVCDICTTQTCYPCQKRTSHNAGGILG